MNMTIGQLAKVCDTAIAERKYLLVRRDYFTMAINPKVVLIKNPDRSDKQKSQILGYRLIGFQEYITNKVKFL